MRAICISRPDRAKNVHQLLKLSQGLDYELDLFLAEPGSLEANEYYVSQIQPYLSARVTVHHNAPRAELLQILSRADVNLVPCPVESFGLTVVEAASYGVPSVVFARERDGVLDHAALHMGIPVTVINVSRDDAHEQLKHALRLDSPVLSCSDDELYGELIPAEQWPDDWRD
jgi:glycosyltransferase involved in cell wall biosynthesis